MSISILKTTKLRHKFCIRMDKTFGCKKAFMCSVSCPIWLAFHVEYLMNEKNYTLGEAFRQTIREAIAEGKGRQIIKDVVLNKDEPYPPKDWELIAQKWDDPEDKKDEDVSGGNTCE